jgi:hypothetical protein
MVPPAVGELDGFGQPVSSATLACGEMLADGHFVRAVEMTP